MAATIFDEQPLEDIGQEDLKTAQVPEPKVAEEAPKEDKPELPEKYKGKSVEEIVRMHQEAEKIVGRQGAEVGELRKIVDEFILSKTQKDEQKPVESDIDFFEKPQEAVMRLIDSHPAVREVKESATKAKQQTALTQLQQRHPDMGDILADEAFQQWIGTSKVRTEMLRRADVEFDAELADELFTNWKERKSIAQTAKASEEQARKAAVKSASTGSASGSGERSRKIYRRADIIDLMQNQPERYLAMAEEISQAYLEKRVK